MHQFVDPRKAFKNHRVCSDGTDWINGLTLSGWGFAKESFHPNAAGQLGLANAIAKAEPGIFR
jgi:hypothetical protein